MPTTETVRSIDRGATVFRVSVGRKRHTVIVVQLKCKTDAEVEKKMCSLKYRPVTKTIAKAFVDQKLKGREWKHRFVFWGNKVREAIVAHLPGIAIFTADGEWDVDTDVDAPTKRWKEDDRFVFEKI